MSGVHSGQNAILPPTSNLQLQLQLQPPQNKHDVIKHSKQKSFFLSNLFIIHIFLDYFCYFRHRLTHTVVGHFTDYLTYQAYTAF
jgi:hypothetical protein